MQDFKNLSRTKRFSFSDLFRFFRKSNRKKVTREQITKQLSPPTGKRYQRLRLTLIILAIVLGITPVCVLGLKKVSVSLPTLSERLTTKKSEPVQTADTDKTAQPTSFEIASSLLESATPTGDLLTARTTDNRQISYTINSGLQQRIHEYFQTNKVPYGVFVAIEPTTGKILAMTAHSSVDPTWVNSAYYDLYPMASLFKIITASAALEARKISPETVIEFRGNSYSENPRYWSIRPHNRNNRMDLTYAMGKSINPVYGRVACDIAGKKSVMDSVSRFGFNQCLLPGTPAKASQATEPMTDNDLMLMGAGLNHQVKISPLHAASIISAIANGGRMMAPDLTDKIVDGSGTTKTQFTPHELRRLVSPETATALSHMLSSTVLTGTSRKAFHDRRGRMLVNVPVAAKTGSINGDNPRGHYSWFAAYAPIQNPKIALVALVINPDKWKIKAPQVGQQALTEFFAK